MQVDVNTTDPSAERELDSTLNLVTTLVELAERDPGCRGVEVARRRLLRAQSLLDGRVPEDHPLVQTIQEQLRALDECDC